MASSVRLIIHKVGKVAVPVVIFIFLGRLLIEQWAALEDYSWDLDITNLLYSFIFLALTLLFAIVLWLRLLRQFGCTLSFSEAFKIFYLSNMGRYIPGKVWQFVGMYYMLEKKDVGLGQAISSTLWVNIFFNLSGIFLGSVILYSYKFNLFPIPLPSLIALLVLIFVVIQPQVINRVLSLYMSYAGKGDIVFSLSIKTILTNLIFYAMLWLCYGVGFFFLVDSVTDVSLIQLPALVGFFALSHVIGFISFLSPGGLGVREGVLTYLLSLYMPLPIATITAVIARVWLLMGELVCVAVALRVR